MKALAISLVLLLAGCEVLTMITPIVPQTQQSLSLPFGIPVVCQPGFTTCSFPLVVAGTTGMVLARSAPSGIKDSLGNNWVRDYCAPFTSDCVYTTYFPEALNHLGDTISFATGEGSSAILLMYPGKLTFKYAAEGDYSHSNADIVGAGCMNGDFSCPYWWAGPVDADAGDLLIFIADSHATFPGVPKPGADWHVEALTDGESQVILEDLMAPVDGLYMGNMLILNSLGGVSGGSHWVAATLDYQRMPATNQ